MLTGREQGGEQGRREGRGEGRGERRERRGEGEGRRGRGEERGEERGGVGWGGGGGDGFDMTTCLSMPPHGQAPDYGGVGVTQAVCLCTTYTAPKIQPPPGVSASDCSVGNSKDTMPECQAA